MPIVTDLTAPNATESLVLDPDGLYSGPVDLGNMGSLRLAALTIPPAPKLPTWATNGDSDGSQLVRVPFYGPRECTMQVRVVAETEDQAVNAVGLLVGKLQEAEKLSAGGGSGLPVRWTPVGATTGLTLYMQLGQITDMPVTYADGWFAHKPLLTVAFTCRPFLYGDEVTGPTATSTDPVVTVEVPDVPGDVPAEARLVLTDGASEARRWVEWGLEQRFYDPLSPWPLLIDSEDLVTSGFSGAQATRTGGYRRSGATHDVVSTTLIGTPVAVCGTGDQPHVGTFRVKARVWAASVNQYWRLAWQSGDGGWSVNDYDSPRAAGDFSEIDMGVITIGQAESGSQKWSGRIEAYSTTASGELGQADYLILYPVEEGYGRIEQPVSGLAGEAVGADDFVGHASSSALGGESAVIGGTWATSGATTDFVAEPDYPSVGVTVEQRSTSSDSGPRFAVLGGTSYTDSQAEVGITQITYPNLTNVVKSLVIVRYTNSSNYAFARFLSHPATFDIGIVVGGTETVLATTTSSAPFTDSPDNRSTIRVVAQASGQIVGAHLDAGGEVVELLTANHSALATGGTLATGKPGFADYMVSGIDLTVRAYRDFIAAIPPPEEFVIEIGESLEIRSDANLRQSADGASYGDLPSRGSRLFIPPAGSANRTTRIVARATRANLDTQADTPLGDSLTAAIDYTPRYLAVPR